MKKKKKQKQKQKHSTIGFYSSSPNNALKPMNTQFKEKIIMLK